MLNPTIVVAATTLAYTQPVAAYWTADGRWKWPWEYQFDEPVEQGGPTDPFETILPSRIESTWDGQSQYLIWPWKVMITAEDREEYLESKRRRVDQLRKNLKQIEEDIEKMEKGKPSEFRIASSDYHNAAFTHTVPNDFESIKHVRRPSVGRAGILMLLILSAVPVALSVIILRAHFVNKRVP